MKGLLWLVVVLAFSSIASAQQEKLEIFGGYSHMQLEGGRQNKSGWNASVAYRLRGPLSLVADASGYYKASRIFQGQFESFRARSSDHFVLLDRWDDQPSRHRSAYHLDFGGGGEKSMGRRWAIRFELRDRFEPDSFPGKARHFVEITAGPSFRF
ncbi:MAG: hypothetical protein EHM23_02960 [Acidobacteria bacterium]|nr:MAG: hypothetical protein EHM23_02960 [Acidobacteriota bacterium]